MASTRFPILIAAALLAGCSAAAEGPGPWQERTPPDAAPKDKEGVSAPTLGTPFYLWSDVLDEAAAASIEFSMPGQEAGSGARNPVRIDRAELVLHSDGFVIGLEFLSIHLEAVPGCLSDVYLRSEGIATGNVLASDPDSVRVEFDVKLALEGRADNGALQAAVSQRPMRLSMRLTRTGASVLVSALAGPDATDWLLGTSQVQGGPLAVKLRGELLAP